MIVAGVAIAALLVSGNDVNIVMEESTVLVSTGASQGSAFFVTPTRLITAAHVVEDVDAVQLMFAPGTGRQDATATVVSSDPVADVAVLALPQDQYTPLAFAKSLPDIGSEAFVIGAPEGDFRVTVGTIEQVDSSTGALIASARVFPGNSGGPMVDDQGRVIGMVTQRTQPSNESVAVGVAELQSQLSGAGQDDTSPRSSATPPDPVTSGGVVAFAFAGFFVLVVTVLGLLWAYSTQRHKRQHITINLDQ